jgi:dTDP-4-amino-4,6-dideoxygalactose transaminase
MSTPQGSVVTKISKGPKAIPLLDLRRGFTPVEEEIRTEWDRILTGMKLFQGDNLLAFEEDFARYLGVRHAFGVASGTDSLILGLIACDIGAGDEVILPANGFMAAVEAIRLAGARPVPVDIEEGGFGPDYRGIEQSITDNTKAILVVHMYGHPVDLDPIQELCRRKGLRLIEDCSHAHGAQYKSRKVGGLGQVGCFSCGVVKNLNAYGDAGAVVTNDDAVAHRLNYLRVHGQVKKNQHSFYGFNSRLDELQAAVLRIKLKYLEENNKRRRVIAGSYVSAFSSLKGLVSPPQDNDNNVSVYHQFVIRTPLREGLTGHLKSRGIGFGVHYPVPLHVQPAWALNSFGTYHLPRVEKTAGEILSLPVFPELNDEETGAVIASVRDFFGKA